MQPLEGIRIADFSHVMAGSYASHLLRLLGAEVIKVEPPVHGDPMGFYGYDRSYDGMSPAFIGVNVCEKSIVLNHKKPAALVAAKKLVASADVVLENFRPGVKDNPPEMGAHTEAVLAVLGYRAEEISEIVN